MDNQLALVLIQTSIKKIEAIVELKIKNLNVNRNKAVIFNINNQTKCKLEA